MEVQKNCVVVLKAAKETSAKDPYVQALEQVGCVAQCVQVLGFRFINLDVLWAALQCPGDHAGLILTSPRSAQAVQLAVKQHASTAEWDAKLLAEWKGLPTFAVGAATAEAAMEAGLSATGEGSGNAEELVPLIEQAVPSGARRPLLFPCSSLRRDTIPQLLGSKGLRVKEVCVYETAADPGIRDGLHQLVNQQCQPEYAVFFSPSGVQFTVPVLRELGWNLNKLKCLAIGPTTASALLERGLSVAGTAAKPSAQDVAQALQQVRGVS